VTVQFTFAALVGLASARFTAVTVGGASTASVPSLVAKSLDEVAAFAVKLVVPVGVDTVVEIVRPAASDVSADAKRIVLRAASKQVFWPLLVQAANEPRENAAVASVGSVVVMESAASKAPDDPDPLPLLTVIV
jgi:hypothetical protein